MDNIEKAQALIRKAESDRKNLSKYEAALLALSELEKSTGNNDSSDFIKNELMEALFIAVGEQ